MAQRKSARVRRRPRKKSPVRSASKRPTTGRWLALRAGKTLVAPFSWARTHWQSLALVLGLTSAAAGFWKFRQANAPTAVVAKPESPAPAALADVQRIMTGDAAPRDARELAAVLEALAAAVETETELVTTTARFRAAVDVALGAVFAGRLQGKYPGLGALIETQTQAVAGLDVRTIQPDQRVKLVATLRDLAAAFTIVGAK